MLHLTPSILALTRSRVRTSPEWETLGAFGLFPGSFTALLVNPDHSVVNFDYKYIFSTHTVGWVEG